MATNDRQSLSLATLRRSVGMRLQGGVASPFSGGIGLVRALVNRQRHLAMTRLHAKV